MGKAELTDAPAPGMGPKTITSALPLGYNQLPCRHARVQNTDLQCLSR